MIKAKQFLKIGSLRVGSTYWNKAEDTLFVITKIDKKFHADTVKGKHHGLGNWACPSPHKRVKVEQF